MTENGDEHIEEQAPAEDADEVTTEIERPEGTIFKAGAPFHSDGDVINTKREED